MSNSGIILACTELSLLFYPKITAIKLIDPTTILAQPIITKAGATLKEAS